jgi:PAS domain S-box-containing protein
MLQDARLSRKLHGWVRGNRVLPSVFSKNSSADELPRLLCLRFVENRFVYREDPIILEEASLWRERYRALFDRNVAGIMLTTPEGRIVDCNEVCARIFGFDSRKDVLAHSAWDFYFNRAEREKLIERLRTPGTGTSLAEEVRLRGRNGMPVWVLATRSVVSFAHGRPELLQGTAIDITPRKTSQVSFWPSKTAESSSSALEGKAARMADLSRRIRDILRRVGTSLQPDSLSKIDRTEMQECFLALEQAKVLMSELELRSFLRE